MVIALTANRCGAPDGIKPGPRRATAAPMLKVSQAQPRLLTIFGTDQTAAR